MQINLKRFEDTQIRYYQTALKEIRNGRKESHWMWFIFPQIKGLGRSYTSQYYAIESLDEAKAYLNHLYQNFIMANTITAQLIFCVLSSLLIYICKCKSTSY